MKIFQMAVQNLANMKIIIISQIAQDLNWKLKNTAEKLLQFLVDIQLSCK